MLPGEWLAEGKGFTIPGSRQLRIGLGAHYTVFGEEYWIISVPQRERGFAVS